LSFLFINKATGYKKQINQSAITLYWPNDHWYKEGMKIIKGFNKQKRNYIEIELKDSPEENKIKLDYAQIRIREILAANDGKNEVHFKLSDSTSYGDFVKAIDILQYEGAKRYMAYENDIWFLHEPPDTSAETIQTFVCGYNPIVIHNEPSKWQMLEKEIILIWQSSWQLIISFVAFLFFSLYSMGRSPMLG
jgi:hypothetical protein